MKTQMTFERYELKYILSRPQLQVVLNAMEPHMRRDEFGHSSIRNLYLDTLDYRLIRRSLERPVYKEKVRIRSYGRAGIDDEVFVELKKKYRSVVYKRRLSMPQGRVFGCLQGLDAWPDTQIGQEIAYTVEYYPRLAPMVFLSYERDAFRAADGTDLRITFVSEGDCVDSNGDLTINGGTLNLTCNGNGDTALDTDGTYTNNGGSVTTNDGSESNPGGMGGGMGTGRGGSRSGELPANGSAPSDPSQKPDGTGQEPPDGATFPDGAPTGNTENASV